MKDLTYSQIKSFKEKLIKFNDDLIEKNKKDFDDYYEKHEIKAVKDVKYLSDDFAYEDIRCLFSETNHIEPNEIKSYEIDYIDIKSHEIISYEVDYIAIKPYQINYIDVKPQEIKSYEAKPYEVEYCDVKLYKIKSYEIDYIDIKPHEIISNGIKFYEVN